MTVEGRPAKVKSRSEGPRARRAESGSPGRRPERPRPVHSARAHQRLTRRVPPADRSLKTEQKTPKVSAGSCVSSCNHSNSTYGRTTTSVLSDQLATRAQGPTRQLSRSLATGSRARCRDLDGEFDPGSGRTLAACLKHASRTGSILSQER